MHFLISRLSLAHTVDDTAQTTFISINTIRFTQLVLCAGAICPRNTSPLNSPGRCVALAPSAIFCSCIISSHMNTSQAQWLNLSLMTDIYVGKVLVQYYLIISYNRLRNTTFVHERQPPSWERTFMNDIRPTGVKHFITAPSVTKSSHFSVT